jgi:hypothetical protein
MTLDEKIQKYAQKLPQAFQEELFDFLQFLLKKAEQQGAEDWESLSLASAMRGFENESVTYSRADLKEVFA